MEGLTNAYANRQRPLQSLISVPDILQSACETALYILAHVVVIINPSHKDSRSKEFRLNSKIKGAITVELVTEIDLDA